MLDKNWTVIFLEDIQLFWKFRVPITPWILKTVQKGTVTYSNLAIVANTFLLLKTQTSYTHKTTEITENFVLQFMTSYINNSKWALWSSEQRKKNP